MSQLKPFTPDYTPVYHALPKLADLSAHDLEPEKILDHHLVKKGNHAIPQVLVKWNMLSDDTATWEDYHVLREKFPQVVAWGQATSAAGEGVMTA